MERMHMFLLLITLEAVLYIDLKTDIAQWLLL